MRWSTSLSVPLTVKHSRLHLHTHAYNLYKLESLKSRILWLSSYLKAFPKFQHSFFFSSFILGAGLICKVIHRDMMRASITIVVALFIKVHA